MKKKQNGYRARYKIDPPIFIMEYIYLLEDKILEFADFALKKQWVKFTEKMS